MSDRSIVGEGPGSPAAPAAGEEARPRVLMVDDYPPNLLVLEGILDPLGLELVSASSGEEALMLVLRGEFALILMDVQMPGMDGFATTSLIKNRERSRHIPVIFLTAISRDAEHVFDGYAHGAVDYLLKPFHPAILRSKVQVFVDLYRQRKTIQRQEQQIRLREREALELRNEARFRELTDALPSIVLGVAPGGRVYYSNRAWREYVGTEADDATDVFHLSGIHPDDAPRVRDQWRRAIDTGEPFDWQFRIRSVRASGYCWHLGQAVPERDEHGHIVGWIATGTDIDDRKRAENVLSFAARASIRLAESLSLAATVDAVAELIVPELATAVAVHLLEDDGGMRVEVYRDARGPGREEALRAATTRIHGASAVSAIASREQTPEQREAVRALEITSWVSVPLVAKGRELGALWVARTAGQLEVAPDERLAIEDLGRRASVALENAALFDLAQRERVRAEEANRVKDQFLATVSHELRSPLSAILGWARMLLDGNVPPEKQPRALESILRSANTQAQLIEDLLDIARITSGKLRLDVKRTTLDDVVGAAIDVVRPSAVAKQIELAVHVDGAAGPVMADPDRLQQVVWNLLANAIKFTPKGGRVSVGVDRVEDHVEISVTDQGDGISAPFLPYVFAPFRQADSQHGGLGLGLAISKEITELHGGAISVTSEGLGRGARFVVSLPVGPVEGE